MKIERRAPFQPARGVTQLMYVGDDTSTELATGKTTTVNVLPLVGAVYAATQASSSKGSAQVVWGGIAALLAYRSITTTP